MDSRHAVIAIAVAVIAVVGAFAISGNRIGTSQVQSHAAAPSGATRSAPTTGGGSQAQSTQAGNGTAVLFNSTQYARYAYLISAQALSQQASSALAGFNITRTQLANGTTVIGLGPSGSNQTQDIVVPKGDKLYFIEAAFGDDGFGFDSSLADDGAVLVNQTGAIV